METQQTNFTEAEQLTLWTEEQLQQASEEGTPPPILSVDEETHEGVDGEFSSQVTYVQLYLPGFEPDEEVED